jgi:hypothetical protein
MVKNRGKGHGSKVMKGYKIQNSRDEVQYKNIHHAPDPLTLAI